MLSGEIALENNHYYYYLILSNSPPHLLHYFMLGENVQNALFLCII